MCGRNSLFPPASDLETRFDARLHVERYRPRYNIAPGEETAVITNDSPDKIVGFEWGLRPSWMGADDSGFINAKSETAAEKRSFQSAWKTRPCLVLSSGFYEWQSQPKGPKQPYRIHRQDDLAFAFAGLWEPASAPADNDTVTILTTDANALVESIHDRMPVILPQEREQQWLTADPDERQLLCEPYPSDDLAAYPISTRVNNPVNDDPQIIEETARSQTDLGAYG